MPEDEPCHTRYLDFASLVAGLRKMLDGKVRGAPQDPETVAEVTEYLQSVRLNPKEWEQYTNFVGHCYTRTLVGIDPNFVVLLLSWGKGQESPIHCHSNSSCWVKVLDGELKESVFQSPENPGSKPLKLTAQEIYSPNQATYIDDTHGVHQMGNARTDHPCVSLHVYAPAHSACHTFDRTTGARKLVSLGTAHSNPPLEMSETDDPSHPRFL
uniref:Cysteine dioxygenase n=1 Tax=Gymnochlora stellata TaxID=67809 RepID=B5A4K0_GYMST|nr:cysteine dioxygenase [Gymnochlora stellata]